MKRLSRKKISQGLVVLILIVFFIYASSILQKEEKQTLNLVNKNDLAKETATEITTETPSKEEEVITLKGFNKTSERNGIILWELAGEAIELGQDEGKADIKKPTLNYLNKQGEPIKIISETAKITLANDTISVARLFTNVIAENDQYVLNSDQAIFDSLKDTLSTSNGVKIFSSEMTVEGGSSFSNLKTDDHKIKTKIKSFLKTKDRKTKEKKDIAVASDFLDYNSTNGNFRYYGNVVAKDGEYIITSNTLTGKINSNQELVTLVAEGDVIIDNKTSMRSSSKKADFIIPKDEIILTGNPEIEQNKSLVSGSKIIYNSLTKKSKAFGDVTIKMLEEK